MGYENVAHVLIRPFSIKDQDEVRRLVLRGLGDRFGYIDESLNPDLDDIVSHYLSKGHHFLVAELNGRIVGAGALVRRSDGVGRLVRMSVSKGHRRQGIGQALVSQLLELARIQGYSRVLVETNHDWSDAIHLYQKLGFKEYDRDPESIHMFLHLS